MDSSSELRRQLGNSIAAAKAKVGAVLKTQARRGLFENDLLRALVMHHPDAGQRGLGALAGFEVRLPPPYRTPTLYPIIPGREPIDISCNKCIEAVFGRYKPEKWAEQGQHKAFRNSIHAGKRAEFVALISGVSTAGCSVCGATGVEMVADHYPVPFAKILDEFLKSEGTPLTAVEVTRDVNDVEKVADAQLRARWVKYHDSHATFRASCALCNSKGGAHGYAKPCARIDNS